MTALSDDRQAGAPGPDVLGERGVGAHILSDEIEGEWLFIVSGLFSVAFGVLLMAKPGAGALTVLWLVAAYAIVFGIVLVMLAFKARGFTRQVVTEQRERHRRTA